ncbi:MAG: RNA-binding transcriptional accessory protein [Phormidium sp. GEM2.Bin31]|nr:RNA-binding transcriptional accessory protein [Phormidium sp. BM_Day4_Bin.17]TVR05985.1 MAG: RNA-binding transcriptional accessory protein [Phormidium sp. GEM2.Bin31]UCJ13534.1 MAG: RNA-binding transcriptional accessory protein [Phormidium sp. PBR-2020]
MATLNRQLAQLLSREFSLTPHHVSNALELWLDGATIPFIARYRKERTGEMTEVVLRELFERYGYLSELEERKTAILEAISAQGKLTEALERKILACQQKTDLEDLYLPYRPKRRTRATIARERGLEPLAEAIAAHNRPQAPRFDLEGEAAKFVNPEGEVETTEVALQGAADILAETIAEDAEIRAGLRQTLLEQGSFESRIKKDYPEGSTKYETYRNYQISSRKIAPHNLLALLRGEREGILDLKLTHDDERFLQQLSNRLIRTGDRRLRQFYQDLIQDAYKRLLQPSITNRVIGEKRDWADEASIETFEANLRALLLAAPAGRKATLGIDPGFRTGCKVAVISELGKFLTYETIFPHQSGKRRQEAAQTLRKLVNTYGIELIAIGNGTASRETERFVKEGLQGVENPPIALLVNEAGASVYSASEVAIAEFPELDVTIRGAISIARRLQDPLAELVKIDPKSIGVGQYQHDVNQTLLKRKLAETVESCVNYVGVDLNTASAALLTSVSGLSKTVANNIVAYRDEQGAFRNRRQLLKVPKLGPKAFELSAGFLRVRDGENPLDNTAVHPERYGVVGAIAKDLGLSLAQPEGIAQGMRSRDLRSYVTEEVGEPTLRDILEELEKPGRDPRDEFTYASFKEGVETLADLEEGMLLEGVVTNVANFGAFVDVGVHQDGLVHISQLANRFVRDPNEIVKVGDVVKVKVLSVDERLKRIGLSMKEV